MLRLFCGLALLCGLACVLSAGAVRAAGPSVQSGAIGGVVPPSTGVHKAAPIGPDNLSYHGGPVMRTNTTYAIYWLPAGYSFGSNGSNYESTINQFFTDVAHDSGGHGNVYSTDPQYYDTVGGGYHYSNYSSTFAGSYVDTTPFPASGCTDPSSNAIAQCLTQQQEAQEVYNDIQANHWTVGNNSIEYFLFTPQNVTSCSGTSCAYTAFCAYHTYFTVGGQPVVWANQPWTSNMSGCDTGARPNGSDADPTINVASHEHNEAITDPMLNAWIDSGNNENGDKCAWTFGSYSGQSNQTINGHSYFLQEEWDNSGSQCLQSFTPPTPTVTSLSPAGGATGSTVTINGTGFISPSDVKFNGTSASSFTIVSATQLTATPAAGTTSGHVSVVTPAGTATSSDNFTVAPTVTSFAPTSGTAGTSVTITGTNLTGASAVSFNGTPASSYTVDSATQITAVVAGGTTTGAIAITTPGGTATSSGTFTVTASPAVASFTPTSGGVGTSVTVNGSGFTGVTGVTFNGVAAASFSLVSDTQLTATVPIGASTGPIAVTTLGGTGTSAGSFTFVPAPTVDSFTPSTGAVGSSVTITGTNLTGATAVRFNGTDASSFQVVSATQITAVVASGTTSGTIAVVTPGGSAASSGSFTVTTATPSITSFSPSSGKAGTSVEIDGNNFTGATAVRFGGTDASLFNVIDTHTIFAWVGGGSSGPVTVVTPNGTATSSTDFTFYPAPQVSSFSPSGGPVGTSVTITGTNLAGATDVKFNGTSATVFSDDSNTQVTATVPSGATSGIISVVTPGGTGTSGHSFTVGAVTITGTNPGGCPHGCSVTITGTGFTGATAVKFNGTASTSFTVNSGTQITAVVPYGSTTGPISVTTPLGTGTTSWNFQVSLAVPSVSNFVTWAVAGDSINIAGNHFTGATSVSFNGVDAGTFTVNSDSQITATIPDAATTGKITVTGPDGSGTSAASLTIYHQPTVASFTPTSTHNGGQVTITGTGFTGAWSVSFGDTQADIWTVDSDTQITATVPDGATTGAISVAGPGGTGTSSDPFTIYTGPAPVVKSFAPAKGTPGTKVTITGSNLVGATSVAFGGVSTVPVTDSSTSITVVVPVGATTGPIDVTTGGGTAESSGTFWLLPVVTSFTPDGGPDGTLVTITGSGFDGTTGVKFGTSNAASFNVVSDTEITATIAPGTTTGYITVTNPGGSGRSLTKFTADWIQALAPSKGGPGTKVTITGSGFAGATAVRFHGTPAASFVVAGDTRIVAVVAAGTTSGPVTVTAPAGTTTSAASFGVPPHVDTFSPATAAAGATVTINGSGFVGATKVTFNTTAASDFTVVSDTKITATIAARTTSGSVTVATPGGTATSASKLMVVSVASFAPTRAAAGATITITGTALTGATGVSIHGTDASSFSVVSDTKITAVVANGTTSGAVTVVTPNGTATSASSLTIVPKITAVGPASAPVGATITIDGAGLTGATAVKVNGTPVAHFTVVNDGEITATIASGTTSGYVTVTTPGGAATSTSKLTIAATTAAAPAGGVSNAGLLLLSRWRVRGAGA